MACLGGQLPPCSTLEMADGKLRTVASGIPRAESRVLQHRGWGDIRQPG